MGAFSFFETALKVQNTNTDRSMQHLLAKRLHVSLRRRRRRRKDRVLKLLLLCVALDLVKTLVFRKKRTHKSKVGAGGRERDQTKGTQNG